ncbi:MAG: hypothetical protein ACW99G_17850 [Candidatus Thorarchaeota archaeon]|jgi:hypothetical protein
MRKKDEPFDIPNIHDSIRNDFKAGMTLESAALEWHQTGHTNFVDLDYARRQLGLE